MLRIGRKGFTYAKNTLRISAKIVWIPTKYCCYVGGTYGAFCFGYSQLYPRQWKLSNHRCLVYGATRVSRTLYNTAYVAASYKYMFWGVDRTTLPKEEHKRMIKAIFQLSADRMVPVILANAGMYIKLGQGIATYAALLPEEISSAFKPLLDSVFKRQDGEVEHIFQQDLGDLPKNIFSEFDPNPIAGASIAQVFLARTKSGHKVAVKVQYYDIAKLFKVDKATISLVVSVFEHFNPEFPLRRICDHVFDCLEQESDFVKEGNNSEEATEALKHLEYVKIPKIFWDHTSHRILTMEFAEGISLVDVDKVKQQGFDSKEVMKKIVEMFSEQIFKSGFIHSDPHPGNILLRKNKNNKTELVLIDHGLYERLTPVQSKAFAKLWHSAILEDNRGVEESGKQLGFTDPDLFISMLFLKPYGKYAKDPKGFMAVHEQATESFNQLPANMALVIRNLRLVQGLNLSFGIPVSRIRLMGHCAVKYSGNNDSVTSYVTSLQHKLKFESHFLMLDVRNFLIVWCVWVWGVFTKHEKKKELSRLARLISA